MYELYKLLKNNDNKILNCNIMIISFSSKIILFGDILFLARLDEIQEELLYYPRHWRRPR